MRITQLSPLLLIPIDTYDLTLDLKYDSARQYYIWISNDEIGTLPEVFINVYRKKARVECQTLDLVKLNRKIMDAHNEVISLSDHTIQQLLRDICAEVSGLFRISEAIAMLDMLAAFAQLTTRHDYIRPELTNTLAIKSARHPIREQIHTSKFIPNDAYATPQSRFQIITGCNMSGKSTYIRSLALITVMAQIGCFVPAQYASFPIVHQLFARITTTDELDANVSTFAAEMREMAFILRNIQPQGMVLVDELGRGTSTNDGLAIAVALAEALLASNAYVWFATHFHDLARILSERTGVVNLHLAAEIAPDASEMTMLYRITEGPVPVRRYGIILAKLVDLPPNILEVAENVSETFDRISQRRNRDSRSIGIARKRKLLLSLREQLLIARDNKMDDESFYCWLKKLHHEFPLQMARVDEEIGRTTESDSGLVDFDNSHSTQDSTKPHQKETLQDPDQPLADGPTPSPILIDSDSDSDSSENNA